MEEQNGQMTQAGEAPATAAVAAVKFGRDKLEAFIVMKPAPGGRTLNMEYLNEVLAKNNVTNGINHAALEAIVKKPAFEVPIPVAKGTASIPGEDAVIKFMFQLHRDLKPKIKPDGTVDFKDFGAIQTITKGTPLVVKKARTEGVPGVDVCGCPITPLPGKDIAIPAGRNVVFSEDKLTLLANIDGQAVYHNDRVSVLNTYTVEGDVSVTSGNINFNGNVLVKGNVQSGFAVKAGGDVEVTGVVEAAVIEAGGDIIIRNGFNGAEKGQLTAGGGITTKFIQSGTVTAGGDIETTYIYNSKVRSQSSLKVIGKGVVIGGHIAAFTRIDAGTFGNESLTKTIVEVGTDPATLKRNQELAVELETCNKNIKALEAAVGMLSQLNDAGKLPPEKVEQLSKSQVMLEQLAEMKDKLAAEKILIDERLTSFGRGFVGVRNIAYPGTVIIIGTEQMPIKSKYQRTLFSRPEGYIKSGPL